MARPIWKGALSFGLVTIPIGLYSAVERKSELSFHLLRTKLDEACSLHLERHESKYAIVEDDDFHRKLHLRQRDQIPHQHGEPSITGQ